MYYDMGMSNAFTIESPRFLEAYFAVGLLAIKKEVIKSPLPPKGEIPPFPSSLSGRVNRVSDLSGA